MVRVNQQRVPWGVCKERVIQGDLPFLGRDDLDDTRGHSPRLYALQVSLKVSEFMISWFEDWNPSGCIWIISGMEVARDVLLL